jgi:hypothetical protein
MSERLLTLVVEGSAAEQSRVLLADFHRELSLFLNALNETDRHLTGQREPATYYRIVDLRHSSPATVVVEALPRDPQIDVSTEVVSAFFAILVDIGRRGTLSEPVSAALLNGIRDMTSPVGRSVSLVRIATDNDYVDMDKAFRGRVIEILRPEESYPGSIRGMLEAINVHREANVFRIYPDFGPNKVSCHFPAEIQQMAISGVGSFVEVRGILKYKTASPYPHEIRVEDIEVFPPDDQLPTLLSLRGAAPSATGEISSEEFVRQLRNASA